MGEAFLVAFLQVLVDKLAHREVFKYFGLVKGVEQKLMKWRATLSAIGAVLNDAEERQVMTESQPLKLWLDELRDLAYDVEDVLEKYATKMLEREIELQGHQSSTTSKVWSSIPNGVFNLKMNSKIQKITERLQEISQQKDQFNLNTDRGRSSTKAHQNRPPSSSLPDGPVIGRDTDEREIIELLSKEGERGVNFDVVSIVGMPGVGKTTLAGKVFKDIDATLLFKPKVWVCVSDEFNLERVTKQILESVTSQHHPTEDFNNVQDHLHKELAGKKFLIVLDDVWNTCSYDQWMKLQSPFRDGAPGSKILLTTRDKKVSKMMGVASLVHNLKPLTNDVCWEVFKQHAFSNANNDILPDFELLREKIVAKCGGLPLVARTLGGLLRLSEIDEWEEILNKKLHSLSNEADMHPVLRLSYHYLPSHLKRCFAYCSILPNDYEFGEKQLILLWMAEGFIQPQPGADTQMEDLGAEYFRELLSRSLFQNSSKDNSKYVMHDLVGDLARWAAGEICFRLEDKPNGNKQFGCSMKARHASYICGWYDGVQKFEAFHEVKHLRTFLPLSCDSFCNDNCLAPKVTFELLPKLQYLRVLSLNDYNISELPNSIGDLKYLRYLDLSRTKIMSLPASTSTLYNLQTLILVGCSMLQALPADMKNLVNLRHLNISGVGSLNGMPPLLSRLTDLQSLPEFVVSTEGSGQSGIKELGSLLHLRGRLHLSRLENVTDTEDARSANLITKERLDVLQLEWSYSSNTREKEPDVLKALQPHRKLKELTIEGYAAEEFSEWIRVPLFPNMVRVSLENCQNCLFLPALGQLPCLKELHIRGMSAVGSVGLEFYGEGKLPFPVLEILEFEQMKHWKKWLPFEKDQGSGVFPCLKRLSIKQCPELEGKLPENLDSLAKLEIVGCEELVVSIANYTKVCEVEIDGCKEVVHTREVEFELLERLKLSNVSELKFKAGEFMNGLSKVKDLSVAGCEELTSSLKENEGRLLQQLISLRSMRIRGNSALVEEIGKEAEDFVQLGILGCNTNKLEYLRLEKCVLKVPPKGFHYLTSLKTLHIFECPNLVCFPDDGLPPSLEKLEIWRCPNLVCFPDDGLPLSLKALHIFECPNLVCFPDDGLPPSLQVIDIECCDSLMYIAKYQIPPNLTSIKIMNCKSLKSLVEDEAEVVASSNTNYCLEAIFIHTCPNLKCLPEGLCHLTNLQDLLIRECGSLVSIPRLCHLRRLNIRDCSKLEELPQDMHNLNSLEELQIDYLQMEGFNSSFPPNLISLAIRGIKSCKKLWELEWGLHTLTSLTNLLIDGEDPDVVSFPPDMIKMETLLPKSLTHLSIWGFPNLKKLNSKLFQFLTSLQSLQLFHCRKLASIPAEALPLSLTRLAICGSPWLEDRCEPGGASKFLFGRHYSYWPKLSHIPCIDI